MVYRGRPSLGCGTCRNRHIKCDQARPICETCRRSGRHCLGYRDWAELWVRDQTQEVTGRGPSERQPEQLRQRPPRPHDPLSVIDTPRDQLALGHFFYTFVQPVAIHPQQRSYFQIMPVIYLNAQPYSPLEAATLALAYSTFRAGPSGVHCMPEARANYQVALNRLRDALLSPEMSKRNETLLTVLLMQTIECITGNPDFDPRPDLHIAGAVALIKLRGRDGFQDPISRKLLSTVRGLAVMRDLRRFLPAGGPLPELPENGNLGVPFMDEEVMEEPLALGTEEALVRPMSQVPLLCDEAKRLFNLPPDEHGIAGAHALISRCHTVDAHLVEWAQHASQPFRIELALQDVASSVEDPYSADGQYWGRVDGYRDLFVARSWNELNIVRIFVFDILVRCHRWLLDHGCEGDERRQAVDAGLAAARRGYQESIDGICASVPFLCGRCVNHQATPLGIYFLFVPLLVALSKANVDPIQHEWMLAQMLHVLESVGIEQLRISVIMRNNLERMRRARLGAQ